MIKYFKFFPNDFRKKWMLIFFSIFVFGIFLALFVSGHESYKESMERIEKTHNNAVEIFTKESLLSAIYGYNKEMIDAQFNSLYSAFPDIAYMAIVDKEQNIIYEYSPKKNASFFLNNLDFEKYLNKKERIESQKDHYWYYGAPLFSNESVNFGFSGTKNTRIYQGSLIFVVDGNPAVKNILDGYAMSSVYVGFIILFVYILLRVFLNKMSYPILKIAEIMDNASRGERDVLIETNSQVKEVRTIQISFKKMMEEIVLREKELKKARDEALDFARKKTEFTATISHEIKTPLNGIIGMLSAINDDDVNNETKEAIGIARDSGDLLMNLVEDILNYSKLDAGHFKLENKEVDLESIINDTLILQSKSHYGKDLSINGIYDKNLPKKFITDRFRIKQLINNLVSNASKFTEDGFVYVNVLNDGPMSGNVQNVIIEVVDSGLGIEEDDFENIFEAYSQKDNSMSRKYSGTGLGLAICKKIVKAMGGQIYVESIKGEGSKFIIKLPLLVSVLRKPYSGVLTGKRILSYSDNLDAVKLLDSLASYASMGVVHSSSLEVFVEKIKRQDHDLIFLSAQDNKLEIEEVLIDLKRFDYIKDTKVFNIKSFFVDDLYGADFNLTSPLTKSMFLQKTASVFENNENNILDLKQVKKEKVHFKNNKKILLMEDNKINMKVAIKILNRIGYENIDTAENGEVGLSMYINGEYDLVLMDCQMPIMNGFESTKKIRNYEIENNIKKCPIIALTANTSERDKEECLLSGMSDFMSKPIRREDVAIKLNEVFSIKEKFSFLK
jgi:signal transduction histidine kinase/CheY-like chemotaxis protein